MKHNCKKLRELRQATDISVSIREDEYANPRGLLLLTDDKKHIGMGVVILHCPFCGKKLEDKAG